MLAFAGAGALAIGTARADEPAADQGNASTGSFPPPTIDQPLPDLVKQLDARDLTVRDGAREMLMLLRRDELPKLLEAARAAGKLSSAQTALLREIVQHVYLTQEHGFAGIGAGFVGVSGPGGGSGSPAVVQGRTIGYDAYRVLREGDTVVGMQRTQDAEMRPIENFDALRTIVGNTRPGEWLLVRVIRNGAPVEVTVRLAARPPREITGNDNPDLPDAQRYWEETFSPALTPATTQPQAPSGPLAPVFGGEG